MASLPDKIISIFLDKQVTALGDVEVSAELTREGVPCGTNDVRRQTQALSPALFQLLFNPDGTTMIHVEPKIEICEQFLGNGCQAPAKTCDKLHICRHFTGTCPTATCRYPHDFAKGINRKIIADHGCRYIDPVLLVKLLRLKKFLSSSSRGSSHHNPRGGPTRGRGRGRSRGRGRGGRGRRVTSQAFPRASFSQKLDLNRQVDVSYPSSTLAKQIDMNMIQMRLNLRGIKVEETFNEDENEYFRRTTIQLESLNDIEQLLLSPMTDDIKFKRTKQTIDKRSFLIKTSISNEQDKIDADRIKLYVDTLIRDATRMISDLSSDNEQIVLIRCNEDFDFDRVQQVHQSRPQLFGKSITLIRIHECDALNIQWNEEGKSITKNDLQTIFGSAWSDIFSFNFPTDDCAEVEFINSDAFSRWILRSDEIQDRFNVTINRIIDNVDETDDARSSISSHSVPSLVDTRLNTSAGFHNRPCQITIRLRSDWAMIAAHPKFKVEYKEFIRKELEGDIDVNGEEVTYNGTLPRQARGPTNEAILEDTTKSFISQFRFKRFFKLDQRQIDILRASATTVAFSRTSDNDYLVAAKAQDMYKLKGKFYFNKDQPSPQNRPNPPHNHLSKHKSLSTLSLHSEPPEKPPSVMKASAAYSMFPVCAPEQLVMFSIGTFEERLQQYLQESFHVKITFERNKSNDQNRMKGPFISIIIHGNEKDVYNTQQDLINLFSSIHTRTFDEKTDGDWTRFAEAVEIIQHHMTQADMICACKQVPPNTVNVSFFDMTNPQFGVDEEQLKDLIKDRFQSATIRYHPQSMSKAFAKECKDLEDQILKRDDYRKNICLSKEPTTLYIFGVSHLVKLFQQNFEQIKSNNDPQSCQITLSERQLNYLKYVARSDLLRLEKQYRSPTYDISLARLSQQEFLAPPSMQAKIKESLLAIAQICETSFVIDEPGFEVAIDKERERFTALVKDKCFLEKTTDTRRIHIPIPKAQVTGLEDGDKPTPSDSTTSIKVAQSTITISTGDLTAQTVDCIVVCSSSTILCKKVIERAGDSVRKEYLLLKAGDDFPSMASNGALPCKKIFFIPWAPDSRESDDIKSTLSVFITTAFTYAVANSFKSIAFPAVGCGGFQFDPSLIAKYMLNEARQQLLGCGTKMKVSFVLLPNEQTIYNAFVQRLNEMQAFNPFVSARNPPTKKDDRSTIDYDKKTITITLISCNEQHLTKCKQDILNLAQSSSTKVQITQQDMLEWSQETIYRFYEFCFKHRVIPTLDQTDVTLTLVGYKDGVNEAEKLFYQLTSETLKAQHLHAVSRGVVWSVELTPDSDTWEQYSFKLNGIIEDASMKNQPHVEFENDQKQKCRIDFSSMQERDVWKTRRVRRKVVDSVLPSTWSTLADQSYKRVALSTPSPEYQSVLTQFDATMRGKYTQIVKIERIQNESWYKQYVAHRDDFKRRYAQLDERSLFHGCPSVSADQIIDKCFNRSFAGVNGTVYGGGVYFHAQAIYSHQYAAMNNPGEKTMFLARVLIGKTCKGDKSMKVPPSGYDTTTDGQHIFVVYHDSGAYADHLITYK